MQHHVMMFYMYHAVTYCCIQAIIIHVCITVSTAKYILAITVSEIQRYLSLIQKLRLIHFQQYSHSQLFSEVENSANISYTCKNNCINVLIYLKVLQGLSHFSH